MMRHLGLRFLLDRVIYASIAVGCAAILCTILKEEEYVYSEVDDGAINQDTSEEICTRSAGAALESCNSKRSRCRAPLETYLKNDLSAMKWSPRRRKSSLRMTTPEPLLPECSGASEKFLTSQKSCSPSRTADGNESVKKRACHAVMTKRARYVTVRGTSNASRKVTRKCSASDLSPCSSTASTCSPQVSPSRRGSLLRVYPLETSTAAKIAEVHADSQKVFSPCKSNENQYAIINDAPFCSNMVMYSESVTSADCYKQQTAADIEMIKCSESDTDKAVIPIAFSPHAINYSSHMIDVAARNLKLTQVLERRQEDVRRRLLESDAFRRIHLHRITQSAARRLQTFWRKHNAQQRSYQVMLSSIRLCYKQDRMDAMNNFVIRRICLKRVLSGMRQFHRDRNAAKSILSSALYRWHRRQHGIARLMESFFLHRRMKQRLLWRKLSIHTSETLQSRLALVIELSCWISSVMKQIDRNSRVIPPADGDLAESRIKLHLYKFEELFRVRNVESLQDCKLQYKYKPRLLQPKLIACHMEHLRLYPQHLKTLTRCLVKVNDYRRFRNAFYCARIRMFTSTHLIQVSVKCRFATMLLAAKSRYFQGIMSCSQLIQLGSRRCAAVLIQAAWKYWRARWYWRRYIGICKVRLLNFANLSRQCRMHIRRRKLEPIVEEFQLAWLKLKIPVSHRGKLRIENIRRNLPQLQ